MVIASGGKLCFTFDHATLKEIIGGRFDLKDGQGGKTVLVSSKELRPILRGYKSKHVADAAREHSRPVLSMAMAPFSEMLPDWTTVGVHEGMLLITWPSANRARKALGLRPTNLVVEVE